MTVKLKNALCFDDGKPIGRVIFGMLATTFGIASLVSAIQGRAWVSGFRAGEEVTSQEAIKFYTEHWQPKTQ